MFSPTEYAFINYFSIQFLSTLLNISLQGTVILIVTYALLAKVRFSPDKKHLLIVLAMISFFLLPLVFQVQTAVVTRLQQRGYSERTRRLSPLPVTPSNQRLLHFNLLEHKNIETSAKNFRKMPYLHWSFWMLVMWACGVSIGILHMLVGKIVLCRMIRRAKTCQLVACQEFIRTLLDEIGIKRRVRVLAFEDVSVPVTCGSICPSIILPASNLWKNLSAELKMAIKHEIMHIKRWDCFTQFLSRVMRIIFWFNPLVWLVFAQQKALQENACDAGVIHSGVPPTDYAEMLLNAVWRLKPRFGFAGTSLSLAKSSALEQRIVNILTIHQGAENGRAKRRVMLIVLVGICFLVFCIPAFSLYDEEGTLSMLKTVLQRNVIYYYEQLPYLLKLQHNGLPIVWPVLDGCGYICKDDDKNREVSWIDIYWHDHSIPVIAAEDGYVVEARERAWTLRVKLAHEQKYSTLYENLRLDKQLVTTGQWVKKGEVIGYMEKERSDKRTYIDKYKLRYRILYDGSFIDPWEVSHMWGARICFASKW